MNARDEEATEKRVPAEAVRSDAEQARRLAEDARDRREQDREALETRRQQHEEAREAAEATRFAGEEARIEAEVVRREAVGEVAAAADSLSATLEQMKAVEAMRRTARHLRSPHAFDES